jgi:hypothetical protein
VSVKPIPEFSDEDAERDFWAEADSTDYIDWSTGQRVGFPSLKPSADDSPTDTRE